MLYDLVGIYHYLFFIHYFSLIFKLYLEAVFMVVCRKTEGTVCKILLSNGQIVVKSHWLTLAGQACQLTTVAT